LLHVKDGYVFGIEEKPSKSFSEGPHLINGGVYRFSKNMLRYLDGIEPSPRGEIELTDLINYLGKKGTGIKVLEANYYSDWIDIGRPWNILDVHERLLKEINARTLK
jgi:bifunctional UDP-N-acetylglucosamine pyrophosphorylase/glucosamine-1-phosphate N-acetyltransferase